VTTAVDALGRVPTCGGRPPEMPTGRGWSGRPGAARGRHRRRARSAHRRPWVTAAMPRHGAARCGSTRPWLSASYIAPCPRRCSVVRVSSTSEVTGPPAHSTACSRRNPARSPCPAEVSLRPVDRTCATPRNAATVFVFELRERNPKRIKRWPYLVASTRRTTCTKSLALEAAGQKIKLRPRSAASEQPPRIVRERSVSGGSSGPQWGTVAA